MRQVSGSKRDRIRAAVETLLAEHSAPMHYERLAEIVLPALGLEDRAKPKDLNTALHDDPMGRFRRVGKGTWALGKWDSSH